jgi:hypothetical protein
VGGGGGRARRCGQVVWAQSSFLNERERSCHQMIRPWTFRAVPLASRSPSSPFFFSRQFSPCATSSFPQKMASTTTVAWQDSDRPVVLSGPSGAGKSTLIKRLMDEFPGKYRFSVSRSCYLVIRHLGAPLIFFTHACCWNGLCCNLKIPLDVQEQEN